MFILERSYEQKPLPAEEIKDASMTPEEVVAAAIVEEEKEEAMSDIAPMG